MDVGLAGLVEKMEEQIGVRPMAAMYWMLFVLLALWLIRSVFAVASVINGFLMDESALTRALGWVLLTGVNIAICGGTFTYYYRRVQKMRAEIEADRLEIQSEYEKRQVAIQHLQTRSEALWDRIEETLGRQP